MNTDQNTSDKPLRVGIIGSRTYENKQRIKDFCFHLKNKYGSDTVVVSGGCSQGSDKYAKKYALELGCKYVELNPSHTPKNLYSYMRESWYGKEYSIKNFHTRNKILAKTIDRLIAFVPEGDAASGTASTVKYAMKFNKKVVTYIREFEKFYIAEDRHQDYYQVYFLNYLKYQ